MIDTVQLCEYWLTQKGFAISCIPTTIIKKKYFNKVKYSDPFHILETLKLYSATNRVFFGSNCESRRINMSLGEQLYIDLDQ